MVGQVPPVSGRTTRSAEDPAPPAGGAWRLPGVVWATAWVSFLTDLSTELVYAVLPAFYQATLGLNALWLGGIEGFAEAVASLTKLFSGHWSDRTGRRKWWMAAGYGLSTVSKPLLAVAGSGWTVLGLRGADRLGKGVRGAPRDALLAAHLRPEQRGAAFGIQRAMDHGGALAGGLAAFVLLKMQWATLTGLFWLALIPGAAAVVVILLFIRDPDGAPATGNGKEPLRLWAALRGQSPAMKKYLGVLGVFALGNSTDALLLARAQQQMTAGGMRELDAAALLPLLWAWLHVAKTAVSPLGGRLSDRVGRVAPLVAGWVIYAGVYGGFAVWEGLAAPWALFAIYGVYYGLVEGSERALVADLEPVAQRRGMAFGLYHFVQGIAALPASALAGGLWWWAGPQAAFGVGAGLAVMAAAGLPWAIRRQDARS